MTERTIGIGSTTAHAVGAMLKWIFVINLNLVVGCLWLRAGSAASPAATQRRIDVVDALRCVRGLGGTMFARTGGYASRRDPSFAAVRFGA
jgi:hypothetical protein